MRNRSMILKFHGKVVPGPKPCPGRMSIGGCDLMETVHAYRDRFTINVTVHIDQGDTFRGYRISQMFIATRTADGEERRDVLCIGRTDVCEEVLARYQGREITMWIADEIIDPDASYPPADTVDLTRQVIA